MFKILTTLLLAALVLILAAAAVVYFGVVNVAADVPHSGPIAIGDDGSDHAH